MEMPDFEAITGAGCAALKEARLADALVAFDAALRLCPGDAATHYRRGETLFLLRRIDEAEQCHHRAMRLGLGADPDARGAAMSGLVPGDFGWMSHILRGDFEAAWRLADNERRQRLRHGISGRDWPRHLRPVWDGGDLAGRHVLVRCYHGLGDTLQFIRYVPLLARRAAAVRVELQPELIEFLSRLPSIEQLHPLPEPANEKPCQYYGCDAEADITELPHACRTSLATIPPVLPELIAERADQPHGPVRVGLAWTAGIWKPERSIPIGRLTALGDIPGVSFVSLQRGAEYDRWREVRDGPPMTAELRSDDVGETARIMRGLDLVISVDTMVAHLAGTLGIPTWLMLHFAADWRWLLDRADTPWYRTMRLFRQKQRGDWDGVVAELSAALAELATAPPARLAAAVVSPPVPRRRSLLPGEARRASTGR